MPHTEIRANTPHYADELWELMLHPFVAKLPKASQGNGVWLIENRADWKAYLERSDVLYVQEYLPINRDIRVGIIGDQVVCAYWRLQSDQGFYNNVAKGGVVDHSPIPTQAINLALHLAKSLDINHAGFDIAMVGDHPYVFEFNRLFGNQGIDGGDKKIREAIINYLNYKQQPSHPNFPKAPANGRKRLRRVA